MMTRRDLALVRLAMLRVPCHDHPPPARPLNVSPLRSAAAQLAALDRADALTRRRR